MASFFGFGRRKQESDLDMPIADNNSNSNSNHDSSPPRPASPPTAQSQGPPPTTAAYVHSPALSPPGSSQSNRGVVDSTMAQGMTIPDIHVFNPAENVNHESVEQQVDDPYDYNNNEISNEAEEDQASDVEEEICQEGEEYNGEQQHQQQQHSYYSTSNNHDNDYPEEEVQTQPSHDSYGTAEEPQQNHVESNHNYDYNEYSQSQQTEQPYYGGEDQWQHQQQQQQQQQHRVETVHDESFEEDNFQQFSTAPTTSEDLEPLPVSSQDSEEYDANNNNHSQYHPHQQENNHASQTPLRETIADNANYHRHDDHLGQQRQPSPSLYSSYSDDSHSQYSMMTTSTPTAANNNNNATNSNRFAVTPLHTKQDVVVFDENTNTAVIAPPKSPRDEIFTPQFKQVHAKTVRRRQNHQQHMQTLERRMAAMTSKLANITMDRMAQECHWLRDTVCLPMELAAQRLSMEREYQSSPHYTGTKNWMSLLSRLSRLETDMTQQTHVEFPKAVRRSLEQPHIALNEEALVHAKDTKKSEKREGSLWRQFESVAATARRRYHEERASRTGAYQVMQQELIAEAKHETDPQRIEDLINKVRVLRSKLEQERVERRMQDEHLKTAIDQEVMSMKRALLEAAGGDDFGEEEEIRSSSVVPVRRTIAYSPYS